ncbi:MAG: TIGR04255 family protein [Beijerinckiaceae bacterium]|nr:TIGR04255 family protein [Beijerinckiaceae bacterium]
MSDKQRKALPERIDPDAILESLVEFRFEHSELPELVLGRLLDVPAWEGYEKTRLPSADIPQPIREADANLRYQPLIELRKSDGNRVAKIGGHVMSYHVVGQYPGWETFRTEIEKTLEEVITKLKSPRFSRIGLRYINALRPEKHFVGGLADTNIVIRVGERTLTESVNVNYNRTPRANHIVTVKVATPDLVTGNIQAGYSLLCDIDVGSKVGNFITDYDGAMAWIQEAHILEKTEFFAILPENLINKLGAAVGASNG